MRQAKLQGDAERRESQSMAQAPSELQQSFSTPGLEQTMLRPGIMARCFMQIVAWAERLNRRCAKLGNPPVYDTAAFPWVAGLDREWRTIRTELEQVLARQADLPAFQAIAAEVASISQDQHWKTFLLTAYGLTSARNIRLCPETWGILQTVPGLKTAMFSIFESGKHLPPHRGPYNGVLRLHLGLIVPEPQNQIGMRVAGRVCRWQEGKALIFDDAYEHEAWNHTEHTRVVLFLDFVKPLRFPANLVNGLLLRLAVFTPYIREGAENHRAWEQRFYREGRRS